MQKCISQFSQLLHELCLAIIAQDISIITQHYSEADEEVVPFSKLGVVLRRYSSEQLTVVSEMSAHVQYGTQVQDLPLCW